ncbi:Hsp70 family protein [Actinomycetospora sp. C-140]
MTGAVGADARWTLAIDHGTTTTVGAWADVDPRDGWVRVGPVAVDGATSMPSAVLSRPDGAVLAGRPALEAGAQDPAAALLRTRPHLAASTGGPPELLTQWPRPTTAVDVATALIAKVVRAEAERRRTLPSVVVLLHPAWWSTPAREALRAAGQAALSAIPLTTPDQLELFDSPRAAAHRLGGQGRLLVVDIGGAATELAVVDRAGDGTGSMAAVRSVNVGAEVLDDALAQLVLDRAPPMLAARVRFGGDLEAHRAWYRLRAAVREAKEGLGTTGQVTVALPVLPPENPGYGVVALDHADLGGMLAPGLEEIAQGIDSLVSTLTGPRPAMLVRGGLAEMPRIREWLAERTGFGLAHGGDPGAVSAFGPASGAAAWAAERLGLGRR